MLRIAATLAVIVVTTGAQAQSPASDYIRFHAEASADDTTALRLPARSVANRVAIVPTAMIDLRGVARVSTAPESHGRGHMVLVEFTADGKAAMQRETAAILGRRLAVVVNDSITIVPRIDGSIGGPVPVAQGLTEARAKALVLAINERLARVRK